MLWGPLGKSFFDDWMPQDVKTHYAPNPKWKDRPFAEEDVRFFSQSVADLSHRFTSKQGSLDSGKLYSQARFRSAYLLYYLPFQASKFRWIFDRHGDAWSRSVPTATRHLQLWDWGAGCGTATLAFLLWCLEKRPSFFSSLTSIEAVWVEPEFALLNDGERLLNLLLEKAGHPIAVKVRKIPVGMERFDASREAELPSDAFRLSFFGHVWNEGLSKHPRSQELASKLIRFSGGHALFAEPAHASIAQWISRLRDAHTELRILGPCLHQGVCPLSTGRDWCHFTPRVDLGLKWWKAISRSIGPEREFLKLSYVFFANTERWQPSASEQRLVVSDIIPKPRPHVLLCDPEKPIVLPIANPDAKIFRGDVVRKPEGRGATGGITPRTRITPNSTRPQRSPLKPVAQARKKPALGDGRRAGGRSRRK